MVSDGAQIQTFARNDGNGGNLTINASDSILLTGTSPSAEFQGLGRSAILLSAESSFEEVESTNFETGEQIFTGEIIPTTGNGGNLTLNTGKLIIEQGAVISADTFSLGNGGNANINVNELILRDGGQITAGSLIEANNIDTERGDGGTLNITATESVEVTGTGLIGDDTVESSIFTLAESTGDAGNINLTINSLTVSDGGEINTSASALGAAGDLTITANSLALNQGTLTAATAAGTGGNINLNIDDTITLENNSLISAAATGTANGGNININTTFIIASPNQDSDILASAEEGTGGAIIINAEGVFGLEEREAIPDNGTNDIDATGGVDGQVIINTPDVDVTQGLVEAPQNVVEPEQVVAQGCSPEGIAREGSSLTVTGKGGVPPEPTAPIDSHNIYIEGESTTAQEIKDEEGEEVKGDREVLISASANDVAEEKEERKFVTMIERSEPLTMDEIVPAMGAIVLENGNVLLTAYPTPDSGYRSPHAQTNCQT